MIRCLLIATALLATGCVIHGRHGHVHAPAVVHVHDDLCGHWHSRHYHGCGHHYRGGVWVRVH